MRKFLLLAIQIDHLERGPATENLLHKNNAGKGDEDTRGQRESRNHPRMTVSRSRVSGMVNFLSTVNIGRLPGRRQAEKHKTPTKKSTRFTFSINTLLFRIKYTNLA